MKLKYVVREGLIVSFKYLKTIFQFVCFYDKFEDLRYIKHF